MNASNDTLLPEGARHSAAEGQILFDTINVGWPEAPGLAQRPSPFGTFALKQMASAGASVQHFAVGGNFETFGH